MFAIENMVPFNTTILTELPSAWLILSGIVLFLFFQLNVFRKVFGEHAQPWLNVIVNALRKPLLLAIAGYLVAMIVSWLELQSNIIADQDRFFYVLDNIQAGVNFIAAFWFIFRFIRFSYAEFSQWCQQKGHPLGALIAPVLQRSLQFITLLSLVNTALACITIAPQHQLIISKLIKLVMIGALAWLAVQIVAVIEQALLSRYKAPEGGDVTARKVHTEAQVLKKIALFIIGLITIASMLMTFDSVRQLGQSLLASAGIAGVIGGIAAQRSLSGMFAGLQIAISQPIKIGDTLVLEGELGQVEEITLTYVVLKLWDLRRMILPINYFIEKPFQNWTRQYNKLIAPVFIYVDYSMPIADLRNAYNAIVKSSALWDGDVCSFQVSEAKEQTLEIRGLISAADSGKAWDLRCEIREKLIEYIQKTYPSALPKQRIEMVQPM